MKSNSVLLKHIPEFIIFYCENYKNVWFVATPYQYSYSKIDPKYIQSTLKKKREREKLKLDIAGFVYRINISTYQ